MRNLFSRLRSSYKHTDKEPDYSAEVKQGSSGVIQDTAVYLLSASGDVGRVHKIELRSFFGFDEGISVVRDDRNGQPPVPDEIVKAADQRCAPTVFNILRRRGFKNPNHDPNDEPIEVLMRMFITEAENLTGKSSDLALCTAIAEKICRPAGQYQYFHPFKKNRPRRIAATGGIDQMSSIGGVEAIPAKIKAALEVLGAGDYLLYPRANEGEVRQFMPEITARNIRPVAVRSLEQALLEIGILKPRGIRFRIFLKRVYKTVYRLMPVLLPFLVMVCGYWYFQYPYPEIRSFSIKAPAVTSQEVTGAPLLGVGTFTSPKSSWSSQAVQKWLLDKDNLLDQHQTGDRTDYMYVLRGNLRYPGRLVTRGDLNMKITVITNAPYVQTTKAKVTPWGWESAIWIDGRYLTLAGVKVVNGRPEKDDRLVSEVHPGLPDMALVCELQQGEEALSTQEFVIGQ